MFSRWGAFVYRFRRPVALLAVVVAVASLRLAAQTADALSAGRLARRRLRVGRRSPPAWTTEFGAGRSAMIALFRSDTPGADATSPEFQAAIATTTAGLAADPRVAGRHRLRRDRRHAVHQHGRRRGLRRHRADRDRRGVGRRRRRDPRGHRRRRPATRYQLTGYGPITKDGAEQSEEDLQKAETVSLPIAALVLILVFASIVAAGMPLLVAGLAIPSTLALICIVAQQVEMSIFVLNIATMLGPRPGDRLLAVHRQPLPRGAAPRPDRRRGGRARGRHVGQGRRVQRHRGRDRPVRPAPVRGAGHPLASGSPARSSSSARCSSR